MKARAFVQVLPLARTKGLRSAQADDYSAARRWKAVIRRRDRDEAELLARKLQSWAAPGSPRIWETAPRNPAAILA